MKNKKEGRDGREQHIETPYQLTRGWNPEALEMPPQWRQRMKETDKEQVMSGEGEIECVNQMRGCLGLLGSTPSVTTWSL